MTSTATNTASSTGNPDDQKITLAVAEIIREFLQDVARGLDEARPVEADKTAHNAEATTGDEQVEPNDKQPHPRD